jgi:SpoVK/Ycf46/Vps4 family AAA+-type ATPase
MVIDFEEIKKKFLEFFGIKMSDEVANISLNNKSDDVPLIKSPPANAFLRLLKQLDRLLERAVATARTVHAQGASPDPYRGLYVGQEEVDRLLSREPGAAVLGQARTADLDLANESHDDSSRLAWLQRTFGLSPFDLDIILVALAAEIDLRYERIYAYLQDDVTKKRPTVDLVLNLLCASAEAKVANRHHFATDAPLVVHGIIHLVPDPNHIQPPLLAHYVKLDDQIVRLLLEQDSLDPRLTPFCRMTQPAMSFVDISVKTEVKRGLVALTAEARERRQPLRVYFHGPRGAGKRRAAEAVATESGARLLTVNLAQMLATRTDVVQTFQLLFREAWFQDAILYLDGLDLLRSEERSQQFHGFLNDLREDQGVTILAGERSWIPPGNGALGVITIPFFVPDFAERRICWQTILQAEGITIAEQELDIVADRFSLLPGQIADAVAVGSRQIRWNSAVQSSDEHSQPAHVHSSLSELFSAARDQCGHELAALAQKITPVHAWDDLILPEDTFAQLREICAQVQYRRQVLEGWGFGHRMTLGKGVNALFAGPSGTGKTTAAEIIAGELELDLYKIDLSRVVSKYIGETEKNCDQIFRAAKRSNAILFFDEADALWGKRSEVKDSHDRYANLEIAYLLQKMDEYEGIAILATNLRKNMDEAFIRRLQFVVEFPFPNEAQRLQIWKLLLQGAESATRRQSRVPVADDIDFAWLARQVHVAGGNIKNIVLAAAYLAASEEGEYQPIGMKHLAQAIRREYQKMGKVVSEIELSAYRRNTGTTETRTALAVNS